MPPDLAHVYLETRRLVLRELKPTDLAAVHAWAADPEVVRYEPWGPNTPEQTAEYLKRSAAARAEEPRSVFELGFVLKEAGSLIGAGGLRIRSAEHLEADIGYTLRRDAWGRGYATEAAGALVELGLRLGMHRIWATCHVDNVRSARVLEKLGMRREGRLRENVHQREGWRDSYLYAVLAGDPGIQSVVLSPPPPRG